jgi:hypothetical protein
MEGIKSIKSIEGTATCPCCGSPGPVARRAAGEELDRRILARLPLAEAAFLALSHCWDDTFLGELFRDHAPGCYTAKVTFPLLTRLVCDALLKHKGSGNAAFTAARKEGRLQAAVVSVYQKLGRLPLSLSVQFLRQCTGRLRQLFPSAEHGPGALAATPQCLAGMGLRVFDGKTIKHLARRLKVLRKVRGKMLGGKLLVCLDPRTGLALAMSGDFDAFRNDAALAPALLAQLPPDPLLPCLFVADRQFCDLGLMAALVLREDHFLIRRNASTTFTPDPAHAPTSGTDSRGRRWTQWRGWLGAAGNPERREVRMITLYRPGEQGGDVTVVTDLLDEAAYPADQLLEAYLARWGIERVFQQVTEVFSLKELIGCTPAAAVFQASFCFLAYNVTQTIKAYVAQGAAARGVGVAVERVSTRKLFDDVADQMRAAATATGHASLSAMLHPAPPPEAAAARMRDLLGGVWTDWWVKCPTTARPKPKPTTYANSGRASVHRLLQEEREGREGGGAEAKPKARRRAKKAKKGKKAERHKMTTKRHT